LTSGHGHFECDDPGNPLILLRVKPSLPHSALHLRDPRAFSIIDVMMATVILVVGMMGMIQAVTIGSEMIATARRQTLAAQIISHELEKLRLVVWDNGSTGIKNLPAGPTTLTIDAQFNSSITACGLVSGSTITLSRSVTDVVSGSMREVTFTVTWTKGGTTTAASTPTGSWLSKLAFYRESPIARTYTRKGSAWFGKYGLNLSYQRS
jgi:hypothetical protein